MDAVRETGEQGGVRAGAGAEWDLTRPDGLQDVDGAAPALEVVGDVCWVADDAVGGAHRFDGGHLSIAAHEAAVLDVSAAGDAVTVVALVSRGAPSTGFVAGMWQEHDDDPRRQYGLFTSLPAYGGDQQVCGHVSHDGRPSPGLPYSRDYSASLRRVRLGQWCTVGFTYDGVLVTSFLDGVADARPSYTEPGPPLGQHLSYAKNPYRYPLGLNRLCRSDFTIGGVLLTRGMGNHFRGLIARVLVRPGAATASEMAAIARRWTPQA